MSTIVVASKSKPSSITAKELSCSVYNKYFPVAIIEQDADDWVINKYLDDPAIAETRIQI